MPGMTELTNKLFRLTTTTAHEDDDEAAVLELGMLELRARGGEGSALIRQA